MDKASYERILGLTGSVLDAYTVALFLPAKAGDISSAHNLAAVFSLGDKVDRAASLAPGQGLVGWVIRHQSPLLVPNFDQRRSRLGYYKDNEDQHIKAFMGCVLPEGRGALCVDSKRQYSFSEKDQKMLYLFAGLLADFYDLRRLDAVRGAALRYYAALRTLYVLRREYARWTDFMHGFLDIVSKASAHEYCALCTLEADETRYVVEGENYPLLLKPGRAGDFSLSSGMAGWVFRHGSPLFSGGLEGKPDAPLLGRPTDVPAFRSMMAIPLVFQRKVRGVLCLASAQALELDAEAREFACLAGEYLAQLLETFSIKCRLRDMHQQLLADGPQPE